MPQQNVPWPILTFFQWPPCVSIYQHQCPTHPTSGKLCISWGVRKRQKWSCTVSNGWAIIALCRRGSKHVVVGLPYRHAAFVPTFWPAWICYGPPPRRLGVENCWRSLWCKAIPSTAFLMSAWSKHEVEPNGTLDEDAWESWRCICALFGRLKQASP